MEESSPISLAEGFNLRDYDSPDTLDTALSVTLTLTQALDESSEGVTVVTSGDVVMTELDSSAEFEKVYTLTNGNSFSQYEEVWKNYLLMCISTIFWIFHQILTTLAYYNNETEPAEDSTRHLSITVSDPQFQPCSVYISVLNIHDRPSIILPEE